jgi:hypothetical protein
MINEVDDRSSSVTDIRIEVTDDEIKELSNYFMKSKDEIQKVLFQRHLFSIYRIKQIFKVNSKRSI